MTRELQLWTARDGAVCRLISREREPRFEVRVEQDRAVIRQQAFHSEACARLVADAWRAAAAAILASASRARADVGNPDSIRPAVHG